MKISDIIDTLRAEVILKKTPSGRSITDYAVDTLIASLEDKKNHGAEVVECKNCKLIISGLLTPEGCPNCGSKDLTSKIKQADILQKEIK